MIGSLMPAFDVDVCRRAADDRRALFTPLALISRYLQATLLPLLAGSDDEEATPPSQAA